MSWNYRIMRSQADGQAEPIYQIHEVFYDAAGELKNWTREPVAVCAESPEEITQVLRMMAVAVGCDVLDAETGLKI